MITHPLKVASVKQIRISNDNEIVVRKIVKDAKMDILTVAKCANLAMSKGFPVVRKLFVKPVKP